MFNFFLIFVYPRAFLIPNFFYKLISELIDCFSSKKYHKERDFEWKLLKQMFETTFILIKVLPLSLHWLLKILHILIQCNVLIYLCLCYNWFYYYGTTKDEITAVRHLKNVQIRIETHDNVSIGSHVQCGLTFFKRMQLALIILVRKPEFEEN